jgi:hypothetical protein
LLAEYVNLIFIAISLFASSAEVMNQGLVLLNQPRKKTKPGLVKKYKNLIAKTCGRDPWL